MGNASRGTTPWDTEPRVHHPEPGCTPTAPCPGAGGPGGAGQGWTGGGGEDAGLRCPGAESGPEPLPSGHPSHPQTCRATRETRQQRNQRGYLRVGLAQDEESAPFRDGGDFLLHVQLRDPARPGPGRDLRLVIFPLLLLFAYFG